MATIASLEVWLQLNTDSFEKGVLRANQSALKLAQSLEKQVQHFGMSAREAKLYDMALKGVDIQIRDAVRSQYAQLDALEKQEAQQQRANQIIAQTRTEEEKYAAALDELNTLLKEGAINQDVFNRAVAQARPAAGGGHVPGIKQALGRGAVGDLVESLEAFKGGAILVGLGLVGKAINDINEAAAQANPEIAKTYEVFDKLTGVFSGIPLIGPVAKGLFTIFEGGQFAKAEQLAKATNEVGDALKRVVDESRKMGLSDDEQKRQKIIDKYNEEIKLLREKADALADADAEDSVKQAQLNTILQAQGIAADNAARAIKSLVAEQATIPDNSINQAAQALAESWKDMAATTGLSSRELAIFKARLDGVDEAIIQQLADQDKVLTQQERMAEYLRDLDAADQKAADQWEQNWKRREDAIQAVLDKLHDAIPVDPLDKLVKDLMDLDGILKDAGDDAAFKKMVDDQKKLIDQNKTFAKATIDATRTPLEKYEAQIQKLNDALERGRKGQAGGIDWDTYGRAVRMAKKGLESTAPAMVDNPALLRGSRDAYTAIVKAQQGDENKQIWLRQLEVQKQQLDVQKQLVAQGKAENAAFDIPE